jgi:hypothetical protein
MCYPCTDPSHPWHLIDQPFELHILKLQLHNPYCSFTLHKTPKRSIKYLCHIQTFNFGNMQFSRLASLSVKRLLIPGTIFVIYTQTAHCENNKVKLLCWGGKKPLDIHFRKSHLKLTNEIKEVALSTEFEAVITGEGKVRIRNNMEGEYKAIGSFGEGGWFSSSPKAKKISAYDSQLYVIDEEGKLWRKKDGKLFFFFFLKKMWPKSQNKFVSF